MYNPRRRYGTVINTDVTKPQKCELHGEYGGYVAGFQDAKGTSVSEKRYDYRMAYMDYRNDARQL